LATSIRTPRATIGGYFSAPDLAQPRAPSAASAPTPFQIFPCRPKWLSVSIWVPVWVFIETASLEWDSSASPPRAGTWVIQN
jgi:hypothetical protein